MADPYDPMKDPTKHAAPSKTLMDKVIELALGAGGGTVTLLSGLLAAVLILYSGFVLYDTFSTEQAAAANAWDLLQFKPEIFDDYETPLNGTGLEDINNNYRAWLTVYDTPIDYPVMQGPDDLYYASHDIYDRVSLTGAIYLAAANSPDFSDNYNVIYGHHMDNGAMFGSLDHMSGSESGVIIAKNAIYDVQFFAVANTDAYESQIYSVGNRMDSVIDFLQSGGEGGVGLGTTVSYFNAAVAAEAVKVVALSTCANANTNGRLVVFGRMTVREYLKDVGIRKVWDDNENQDGLRPESLTVTLSNGTEVELNEGNDWSATLRVPKYDDNGEIEYTWSEPEVEGYTLSGTTVETEEDGTVITTLTNTHTPATTERTVAKVWDDQNNTAGIRPANLRVTLMADGAALEEITLNAANGWTATVADLPVYANGVEIIYTWSEREVLGYSQTGNTTVDTTTTLTNMHRPAEPIPVTIDEYETPLGLNTEGNMAGDSFD